MNEDDMSDTEIILSIRKEMELRADSQVNPDADPSLYAPWGILGPEDYKAGRHFRSNKSN